MGQFLLRTDDRGSCLVDLFSARRPLRVRFDEAAFVSRLKRAGSRSELVARAVKATRGTRVLDCTAGLGKDAFLLAWLGCEVTMVERSKVIAMLLRDGLSTASGRPDLAAAVSRLRLIEADASEMLAGRPQFDVAFIDPMFPARHQSAAVRGEMQIMQQFLGTDQDAEGLLVRALESDIRRVVLKRPARSDWSSPVEPTHVFSSRNARYEVFVR